MRNDSIFTKLHFCLGNFGLVWRNAPFRKMKPRFSDEDEGRILILQDLQKIEDITSEPRYFPGQVLDVFTVGGIRFV